MTDEIQAAMPAKSDLERAAQIVAEANSAGFTALDRVISDAIHGCQMVIDAGTVDGIGESPVVVRQATKLKNDLSMWQKGLQAVRPGVIPGMEAIVVPQV